MSTFVVSNAATVDADALRDAFNASFAGYLVTFPTFDADGWQTLLRRQGCDLSLSFAALRGDVVEAFALITPRPHRRTRVAVMGARPEARGTGIAARLLEDAVAAAIGRGDKWIELEAFAQNERAVRLYGSRGFDAVDALYGYIAQPGCGMAREYESTEISRDDAARWASAFDREHPAFLPWQAGGEALLALPGDVRAWRADRAQMAFQESATAVSVISLIDHDATQAGALRLLAALRQRYPEHALGAPQLHREHGAARAFEEAGWVRQELHQLLLRRTLSP